MTTVDNTVSHDTPAGEPTPAQHTGAALRSGREAVGLRISDVALRLNLTEQMIAALESGDYTNLRSSVHVRGHLRAYANLVAVDVGPLQLQQSAQPVHDAATVLVSNQRRRPLRQHFGTVATVVLLCGCLTMLWFQQEQQAISPATAVAQNSVTVDRNDQEVIDQLKRRDQAMQSVSDNGTQPLVQSKIVMDTGTTSSVVPASMAAASDSLTVSFSGDCWLEVRDADNRVLVAELKHANDKLLLEGKAPFSLLLGYAPVVSLHYNGQPVEIASMSRNNSARIVVGKS